jgi:2-polyprenyl-6-methoxyphenol hydroxylase-like FAD-dependent oxidoreductase
MLGNKCRSRGTCFLRLQVLTFWADGEKKAFVRKSEGGSIFPSGINCPQPQLAQILLEHLTTKYDAEARFCQKVVAIKQVAASVNVTAVDPRTNVESLYTCDWLVGADGAGSSVRKLMNIDFEGYVKLVGRLCCFHAGACALHGCFISTGS